MRLSIVIAAFNDISSLERCLSSLNAQTDEEDIEVIVASNYDQGTKEMIEKQFPRVKHLSLPADTTVPELRTQGISHSSGGIVAITEDHFIFDPNWCSEVMEAHELPYGAIGGSVENASCERLLDWAYYFYDYGKYMRPIVPRVIDSLSGANVSYKRSALAQVENSYHSAFFETFIHEELKKRGHSLYIIPSAVVYHNKSYVTKDVLIQPFHQGRSFGGMRISNTALFKRFAFIVGALLLPIILPFRVVSGIWRKGRHMRELLLSLPYLLLFTLSWSVGEFWGYLFGEGSSSRRWK